MTWKRFVEDFWLEKTAAVAEGLDGGLDENFLAVDETLWGSLGIITNGPYAEYEEQVAWLGEQGITPVACPPWGGLDSTSMTMLRATYHVARGTEELDMPSWKSVVHWGGGVGLQSLILRSMGGTFTEYIIDIPVMSQVQYQFLGHNLGWDHVHYAEDSLVPGVINVVPLSRVDDVPDGHDAFIAFHSLSESTVFAQDYVVDRDWFHAKALTLTWTRGHPDFKGTSHWEEIIDHLPNDELVAGVNQCRIIR